MMSPTSHHLGPSKPPPRCKTLIMSAPPFVVFVVTIFAFALTTFALGFMANSNEKLMNPDTFDWNTFLSKLSQMEFCVGSQTRLNEKLLLEVNETATEVLDVPMTAHYEGITPDSKVKGKVLMNHMDRGRLNMYHGMVLDLTFYFGQKGKVCLEITGPKQLISDLNLGNKPGECVVPPKKEKEETFAANSKDHLPHQWCANGTAMNLVYELRPDWIVYVQPRDKDLIKLHMLCTSAFLFVLAVGLIVAALCRMSNNVRKTLGDDRGDMVPLSRDEFE